MGKLATAAATRATGATGPVKSRADADDHLSTYFRDLAVHDLLR